MNEINIGDLVIYDSDLRWIGLVVGVGNDPLQGEWAVQWFKHPDDYKRNITYHCEAEIRTWKFRASRLKDH